jgi:hypothetical protein
MSALPGGSHGDGERPPNRCTERARHSALAGSDGTGGHREDIVIEEVCNDNAKCRDFEGEDGNEKLWDGRKSTILA